MQRQVEELFQASRVQTSAMQKASKAPAKQLAVLDLKRATAIGIRMSRLRYNPLLFEPACLQAPAQPQNDPVQRNLDQQLDAS